MKTITLLVALDLIFVYNIFCNESILSKFHQNGFKIKDVRADLLSYDKNYFNHYKIKTFKYNRTTPAVNISVNFKVAVHDKLEVVVQAYKFLSNEYRHFPLRFQTNLQKLFKSNAVGIQGLKSCGNIESFWFEKDVTYYACNFVIDETRFPPLIPNGRYQVNLTGIYLDKELAVVASYCEIYTPIQYP